MASEDDYPVAVFQDRYGGTYSGGSWMAVAKADQDFDENNTRAQFCLVADDGPAGDDTEAAAFWANSPSWIAVGRTPEVAIQTLRDRVK